MAHDTHAHDDHGTTHHAVHNANLSSKVGLGSSFWVAIILVGLFVAAVNFIGAMSGGGHDEKGSGLAPTMEATSNGTEEGETGLGKPMETTDTTQHYGAVHGEGSEAQTEGH